MIALVKQKYQEGKVIAFISARSFRHYPVTIRWLRQQGIYRNNAFLVHTPQQKVKMIKQASALFRRVEVYDDFSYNHEQGEVKFYHDCIDQIQQLPNVTYLGYSDLLYLQGITNEE